MKLALISDIHEHVNNLREALQKIEKLSCDEIVCLGDISGFSVPHYDYYSDRSATECLRLIRENCKYIVPGNHDYNAMKKVPLGTSDFSFPENWYSMDYHDRSRYSEDLVWLYDHDELDPLYKHRDIEYLNELGDYLILEIDSFRLFLSHYLYPNISGAIKYFCHRDNDLQQHFEYMETNNFNISFSGHTHYPGILISENGNKLQKISRKKKAEAERKTAVLVPALAGNTPVKGFCVFDTKAGIIRMVKL